MLAEEPTNKLTGDDFAAKAEDQIAIVQLEPGIANPHRNS